MKRLEKVTYEEVMKLASVLYNPQDWSWVGLGPRHLIKEDSLCQEIC